MLGVTHLTINDEPIYMTDMSRNTSFINSVKERNWNDYKYFYKQVNKSNETKRDIIKMYTLQQGNVNTITERKITTMFAESGTLGGIGYTLLFMC